MLKAVYVNGHLVTGITHADAFSKLPEEHRVGNDFLIGLWCPSTGKFSGDGKFFFTKKLLLVRHGEPVSYDYDQDPGLSGKGVAQVLNVKAIIRSEWKDCAVYSSPARRCRQTAYTFRREVIVDQRLDGDHCSPEDVLEVMEDLPDKSVVVSHAPFIETVARLVGNESGDVPLGSMTLIDHQDVVYFGKEVVSETTR